MLKEAVRNEFLTTLLGLDLSEQEKDVLCTPTQELQHPNSRAATESIILALKNGTTSDVYAYQPNSRVVMQNKIIQDKVMHTDTDTQKLKNQFM